MRKATVLNQKLFDLIVKYGIYDENVLLMSNYKRDFFVSEVERTINDIGDDFVIALRGGGRHTRELLKDLSIECRNRIEYIIDNNDDDIMGIKTIPITDVEDISRISHFIVSSYKYNEFFIKELTELSYVNGNVVSVYDNCAFRGVSYFEDFFENEEQIVIYPYINNSLSLISCSMEENIKQYYYRRAIAQCIEIRDFVTTNELINEYINKNYDVDKRYKLFSEELDNLLADIKDEMFKNNKKEIRINWIDNISYDEFYSFDYAKEKRGISFSNAYSTTPWTHITMTAMLTGRNVISGKGYKIKRYTRENSKMLRVLDDYGYRFFYLGNQDMLRNCFEKENYFHNVQYKKDVFTDRAEIDCSPRLQWEAIQECLNDSDRSICFLIHNLAESHAPFSYVNINNIKPASELDKRNEGMKYLMKQLAFYDEFWRGAYNITLSDHGDSAAYGDYAKPYKKRGTNIVFIIENDDEKCIQLDGFYNHSKFADVLELMLQGEDEKISELLDDFHVYENIDYANSNAEVMLNWQYKDTVGVRWLQWIGVRTKDDLYIMYQMGKEEYYVFPDEDNNQINNPLYEKRISELRNKISFAFIDVNKEPGFVKSSIQRDWLEYWTGHTEEGKKWLTT